MGRTLLPAFRDHVLGQLKSVSLEAVGAARDQLCVLCLFPNLCGQSSIGLIAASTTQLAGGNAFGVTQRAGRVVQCGVSMLHKT